MKEVLGRLYLWQRALNRIIELIEFKQRIDRFCNTGRPRHITDLYDEERKRLKTGLRLDEDALKNLEEKHGFLFPDIHDTHLINELVTEEIIIKFCTIFNDGHGKEGVAANNNRPFREPILERLILESFSDEIKFKFRNLIKSAKAYRNKQGAHFDQDSFKITHGDKKAGEDGLVYSVGWNSALLSFDWDFVSYTIPIFNSSLNHLIKKLQKEAGII